jgi:putative hydrolase of the HAD superfamily
MSKYSVIVFDLGNVLIPFDYAPVLKKFNNIKEGMGDRFKKLYADNYHIHQNFERGKISLNQFLAIMHEWTENILTDDEFIKSFSDIFTFNRDVIDLLPMLKENYTLVLLSNTNEMHKRYGYEHHEFMKHFDKLILSHEVGAIKPEENIYKEVEKFTQRPSHEHLFIDDIKEYVEGAKRCGWDAIQFISYEKLVEDLKLRNIL